jgi:hypothetical protein
MVLILNSNQPRILLILMRLFNLLYFWLNLFIYLLCNVILLMVYITDVLLLFYFYYYFFSKWVGYHLFDFDRGYLPLALWGFRHLLHLYPNHSLRILSP